MDGRKSQRVGHMREPVDQSWIVLPVRTHFVLSSSVLDRQLGGVDAAEMTNYSFLLLSFLGLVAQTETSCSQ